MSMRDDEQMMLLRDAAYCSLMILIQPLIADTAVTLIRQLCFACRR